jgi:hypothetical protein
MGTGLDSQRTERLVVIAVLMVTAGLSLPTYAKLAAKLTARGVTLSWFHHLGLFALALLLGLVGLLVIGLILAAVAWGVDGAAQLLRRLQHPRR